MIRKAANIILYGFQGANYTPLGDLGMSHFSSFSETLGPGLQHKALTVRSCQQQNA